MQKQEIIQHTERIFMLSPNYCEFSYHRMEELLRWFEIFLLPPNARAYYEYRDVATCEDFNFSFVTATREVHHSNFISYKNIFTTGDFKIKASGLEELFIEVAKLTNFFYVPESNFSEYITDDGKKILLLDEKYSLKIPSIKQWDYVKNISSIWQRSCDLIPIEDYFILQPKITSPKLMFLMLTGEEGFNKLFFKKEEETIKMAQNAFISMHALSHHDFFDIGQEF